MKRFIKKIQNTAFQHNLWREGSKIVLGVSGGPDSACLLDIMAKLSPKYDLHLIIAHVNYGLRGRDSERDERSVKKLGENYGVKVLTLSPSPSPKAIGRIEMPSENELRDIRYKFFEKIRSENNFDMIAVAHNADDQVETFLMRVIRGAGLKGLSAMKYKNGKLIRPLLGTTRTEILGYLKKNKLTYRTDQTNKSDLFFRNKVRNQLIPYLEKNFNPKIKMTIFDSIVSIAEDHSLIQNLVEKVYRANKNNPNWSAQKLGKLEPALKKRILLKIISEKKPGLKDITAHHILEIIKAIESTKSKNQSVTFKGLKMMRKGDRVTLDNF